MTKLTSKRLAVLFISLAALCLLAFLAIGSSIDADGRLHEPFGLIPLAWLSLAIGAAFAWLSYRKI